MRDSPAAVDEADSRPRKRKKELNLRQDYAGREDYIWERFPSKCCKRLCHIQLGVGRCRYLRKSFLESSIVQRKRFLLDFRVGLNGAGVQAGRLKIDGLTACEAFWTNVLNVPNTLQSAMLGRRIVTAMYLPGRIRSSQNSESGIVALLKKLVNDVGDPMQHKSERHLPRKLLSHLFQIGGAKHCHLLLGTAPLDETKREKGSSTSTDAIYIAFYLLILSYPAEVCRNWREGNIVLQKKFFERKSCVSHHPGHLYLVIWKEGFSATAVQPDLVLLEQGGEDIGRFLRKVPGTNKIPLTKFKPISISEADDFLS